MRPRPYQYQAVHSIYEYFYNGGKGNPVIAMPTGAGKSIVPPLTMQWAMESDPTQRMLLLTHVKELSEQNVKNLKRLWPTAPVGIYSSGLGQKEAYAPLVFGGIASVKNAIKEIGFRHLLFIDEAHLVSPNEDTMYKKVISELLEINPNMKVIGLTATPFRMGQGRITDDGIFTDIVFDNTGVKGFNDLLHDYYLSPLIPKKTENIIDVSDVRTLAYDFNQGELQQSISKQGIIKKALEEAYYLSKERKCWIVFGAGIENCEQINTLLNAMGIASTVIHSKISDEIRDTRLKAFKAGNFQAIVSNNVLTTGFDHAKVDLIIDLRPTTSVVLHVQKYGRGTRCYYHESFGFEDLHTFENRKLAVEMGGKLNCKVLDFAANTNRLGPINDPRIPNKKGDGSGDVPVKLCDSCGAFNHISARECCYCGEFFVFKVKIKAKASESDIIITTSNKTKFVNVSSMISSIHQKPNKSPKLKVSYFQGFELFNVWLDFEGIGFSKHKAHDWWRQHVGEDIPVTVAEACSNFGKARKPSQLRVNVSSKFSEILEYIF